MARLLADNLDPDLGVNIGMQPHSYGMKSQRLDRLTQLDPAAVYLEPLLGQAVGNVVRCDRPEQLALFAGLAGDGQRHFSELVREGLRVGPSRLDPAAPCLGLRRDPLLVAFGCFVREALRKEEVARIAGADPHQLSGSAERLHIFSQDHFDHRSNPPVPGDAGRRRKSSQVSARPRSVSPPSTNGKRKKATSATSVVVSRGTRPAPAPTTASPRAAYRATATKRRLAPASPRAGVGGNNTRARPATGSQTIWSLNRKLGNGAGGLPIART